jgi:hypothetical protein
VAPIGAVAGYVKKPFHLDDLVRMVTLSLGTGRARSDEDVASQP